VAIIGLIGGITFVTIAFLWVVMRLVLYNLKADSDVTQAVLSRILDMYKGTILALLLAEFWPGLAHALTQWTITLWNLMP